MQLDIKKTPFSRKGSAISFVETQYDGQLQVYSMASPVVGVINPVFDLQFKSDDKADRIKIMAKPHVLCLSCGKGQAYIYLLGTNEAIIWSKGMDFILGLTKGQGFGYPENASCYKFVVIALRRYVMVEVVRGSSKGVFKAEGNSDSVCDHSVYHHSPELRIMCGENESLTRMKFTVVEDRVCRTLPHPEKDIEAAEKEWEEFLSKMPAVPEERRKSAELSWYTLWSCFLKASGYIKYDAVLMSKRYFAAVWSWDHCFNALALSKSDFNAGIEQFLLPFALQCKSGVLPDGWQTDRIIWTYVKPPIHGWCIKRLLSQGHLETKVLRYIYNHLEKWTDWWFKFRDIDRDGIPNYVDGKDSGWDNATVFDKGFCMETPDLSAYLVIQMQALADIALRLKEDRQALLWQEKAAKLLERLYEHFWVNDMFVAKTSSSHEYNPAQTSLINYMPLVLGQDLDKDKFNIMVSRLTRDFLTDNGLASESIHSPHYESEGYWRGPIWAPSTYLLVDGLWRGGRKDLAVDIARRFCDMVERAGGNYENYDALSGKGLREIGYTWTASVNILFLTEILLPAQK